MDSQEHQDQVVEMVRCMVASLGDDVEFPVILDAVTTIACNIVRQAIEISPEVAGLYVDIMTEELRKALSRGTCQ